MKIVSPLSGGLDSTSLLFHALKRTKDVTALSFIYGQRHVKEIAYATKTAIDLGIPHKIIDLSFFKELTTISSLTNIDLEIPTARKAVGEAQTSAYIPFRNLMLLSIACAYAENIGATIVYHGAAQVDSVSGMWDGSTEFFEFLNKTIYLNRKVKVQIETPLITLNKAQIILQAQKDGINFNDTWTCYAGETLSCGVCTACSSRLGGFIAAKMRDPLVYQNQDKLEEVYKQNGIR